MSKVGSRRTGSIPIDLSETTGVVHLNGASSPSVFSIATQEEAEVGASATALMTAQRTRQAIAETPVGGSVSAPFAWGDATPLLVGVATSGRTVESVTLTIKTPFDGVGASLAVGKNGDLSQLMTTSQIDPTTPGTYKSHPVVSYSEDTNIYIAITPGSGATAGNGVVTVAFHP